MSHITLKNRLRLLRKKRGVSQRELARRAGMQHPAICRIERGERVPTFLTMKKIAGALDVDVSDLFS